MCKDHRRIEMALKLAHVPAAKELSSFDFEAQPSIDPKQIRNLAASRWIADGENVLLLGPLGVGKTHLAIALGGEAILSDYSVQFTTAMAVVAGLATAHGEKRLDEEPLGFAKAKLIIDELGYLPLEPDAAHLFFRLVSSQTRAWPSGAQCSVMRWWHGILDRLLHHSHVLTIRDDSYACAPSVESVYSRRRLPVTALQSAPPPSALSPATINGHHEPSSIRHTG